MAVVHRFDCGHDHQGSISSTFHGQLLYVTIPKAQKDTNDLTVFLLFWDLCIKAVRKHVVENNPRVVQSSALGLNGFLMYKNVNSISRVSKIPK
jgi:hypothetical protein